MKPMNQYTLLFSIISVIVSLHPTFAKDSPQKCDVGAYVIDPDPNGLNVRDKPSGQIVARIPIDTMLTIIEISGKWVRIADVSYVDNEAFAKKNSHKMENSIVNWKDPLGWVHISKLETTARKYSASTKVFLNSQASQKSNKLIEIQEESAILKPISCQGEWIQVDYKKKKGWLHSERACANPYTNCS